VGITDVGNTAPEVGGKWGWYISYRGQDICSWTYKREKGCWPFVGKRISKKEIKALYDHR